MTSIRVAAILFWVVAAGFGLSVIPVSRYLIVHGQLPIVPALGFRAFGGGFFERFATVPFVWLLAAFFAISVAEAVAGWLLWNGARSGAVLGLALLPLGAIFWWGFALPIPPIVAFVRTVLIIVGWDSLRP